MYQNEIGLLVEYWWKEIGKHFPNAHVQDEYVIMPNHFHGIIWIYDNVGADRCVRPPVRVHSMGTCIDIDGMHIHSEGAHIGPPLPKMVQWFKTMTMNMYFQYMKTYSLPFGGKLWQRNYYERIIRTERELNAVRQYIRDNPLNWDRDGEERAHYHAPLP